MWRLFAAIGLVLASSACGFEAAGTSDIGEDGEPVSVGFLSATSLQDESSGTVMVPVSLSSASEETVKVRFAFSGGSAMKGSDFTGSDGELTFAPGQIEAAISLTINGDGTEEVAETIQIALASPTNALVGAGTHTISISANILPRVTFMAPTSSDMENVSPTIMLKLDPPSLVGGTVDYVIGGSATSGRDYTLAAGTITIPPNSATYSMMLPVTDDPNDEIDESVTFMLTSSVDLVVGATGPTHAHTIVDNDAVPNVSFTVGSRTVNEDGLTISLAVALSIASGKEVKVTYAQMTGSTALDGSDFNYLTLFGPKVLTYAPGDTSKSILLLVGDDNLDEDNEVAITILSNPINATLGNTLRHDLTINDDDTSTVQFGDPGSQTSSEFDTNDIRYTYNVMLSGPSTKVITVPVTVGGSASSPNDYTIPNGDIPVVFPPGETSRPIQIDVKADSSNESTETVTLQLGAPTNAPDTGGPNATRTHTIVNDD